MKTFILGIAIISPALPAAAPAPLPDAHTATSNQTEPLAQKWMQNQLQYLSILQQITDTASAQTAIAAIEKNHITALQILHDTLHHENTHQILTRTEELLKPYTPTMEAELLRLKNADYYGNEKLKQLITEGAL